MKNKNKKMKITNKDNIFICDVVADGKSGVMQMEKKIGWAISSLFFSVKFFFPTIKILKLTYY